MAVPLPRADIDGFGATYIPRDVRLHGARDLLLVAPTLERLAELRGALERAGVPVLHELDGEGEGVGLVIRPSPDLAPLALWTALGLGEDRLADPKLFVEAEQKAFMEQYAASLRAIGLRPSAAAPRRVGLNMAGSVVFDTIAGRVAVGKSGEAHYEHDLFDDGRRKGDLRDRFLRATSPEELSGCARGVALGMLRGESYDAQTIRRVHRDVVGPTDERPQMSLFAFQEEIETWSAILVAKFGPSPRENAQTATENAARHGERPGARQQLQQYSTPLTIVEVGQAILRVGAQDRVLEPTAGNGVLASMAAAAGAAVHGFELDERRAARAARALGEIGARELEIEVKSFVSSESQAAIRGRTYDVVLANPPFSAIPPKTVEDDFGRKVRIGRLDHEIAMSALARVEPDTGRAFLILPGEMQSDGDIHSATKGFDTYLRATYEVAGSAMLDGRLYRKSGAEFPVIVYALGPRLERPLPAEEARGLVRDRLPFIRSLDELHTWSDAAAHKMAEIFARRADGDFLASRQAEPADNGAPALAPAQALAPIGEFVDPPDRLVDDFEVEEDPFQVAYSAASTAAGQALKIQRALAGPVAAALADLEAERGPIDAYVADRLGLSAEELSDYIYSGQIDSVGLALHNGEKDRATIIGDLMGVGKGRQLAAIARATLKDGGGFIFLTDQANLFTDFAARDLATVLGKAPTELGEILRPHIVNADPKAAILDPTFEGERTRGAGVLFKPDRVVKGGDRKIAASVNAIFTTYSQYSAVGREEKMQALVEWVAAQEKPPTLLVDEAHRAAGDTSKVGELISELIARVSLAGGRIAYSSGTALKGAKNIRLYGPALPDVGMPTDALIELMQKEPIALQEALSFEMARSGCLISRELDNSDVQRKPISLQDIDPERYAKVLEKVDLFAGHLSELLSMGREIRAHAKRREEILRDIADRAGLKDDKLAMGRVGVHYQSPASRFHAIANYLSLSVNGVFLEDLVMKSIAEGRKPLVTVANTGEALLVDLMNQAREAAREDVEGETLQGEVRLPESPHLGHVLKRLADRLLTIKEMDAFGVSDERRLQEFEGWLVGFCEAVDRSDLALLSLSVIDDLRERLAKHGVSLGELTKRNYALSRHEDGTVVAASREKPVVYDVVSAFNTGQLDVLVLNQSAAVGLSAQSSPANGWDVRQREMIKAQLQADVTAERQIDGRINRVGQIFPPVYTVPLQGLAASDRLAQLFNLKNRSLTASSTATRENDSNISEALDLMNVVGQAVCAEFLRNNEAIAEQLDINPEGEARCAEKLMGRLIATSTATQAEVMSELDNAFQMRVGMLDALGENPLRLREYNWYARSDLDRLLVAGDEKADRMSDLPMTLQKLTYTEAVHPMTTAEVLDRIDSGRRALIDAERSRVTPVAERLGELFANSVKTGELDFGDAGFDYAMSRTGAARTLGAEAIDVEVAARIWAKREELEREELKGTERVVIESGRKAEFLLGLRHSLEPGVVVTPNPNLFQQVRESTLFQALADQLAEADVSPTPPAVVTKAFFNEERPLNFGAWDIQILVPGEERTMDLPLASGFSAARYDYLEVVRDPDREAVEGTGWVLRAAHVNDDGLGLFMRGEVGFSSDQRAAIAQAMAEAPPTRQDEPGLIDDEGSPVGRVMTSIVDNVAGGEVRRTRYAIEGNLFAAVSMCAGRRMGEKALYVDEDGTIRHCFLLRKDGHKKLMEQLDATLSERVGYLPADPTVIAPFLAAYRATILAGASGPEQRGEEVHAGFVNDSVTEIARYLRASKGKPLDPKAVEATIEVVRDNFDGVLNDLVLSIRAQRTVNSGLFVGPDPFIVPKRGKVASTVRVLEGAGEEPARIWTVSDKEEISKLTAGMAERSALVVQAADGFVAMVKAKNTGAAALVKDWPNSLDRHKLRHGVVANQLWSASDAAEALCAAARDERFDQQIGLKGAAVAFHEVMKATTAKLGPEIDRALREKTTQSQTVETHPVPSSQLMRAG